MKRNFMWMTWGLISLIALLTIGYKSIASELEKTDDRHQRPVIVGDENPSPINVKSLF